MNHLYCRLAVTNLKKNKQFYLPYLLAGMVSVMMFYIMRALQGSESIHTMRGASTLEIVFSMGIVIVGVCGGIFLFYTNIIIFLAWKKGILQK